MAESDFSGQPILLDGALGTELERRGFDARLPLWSAWALIEAPDLISRIHRDYVTAGAQVLTGATFRTTRYTLAKENLGAWAEDLTALAIRLARDAAADASHPAAIRIAGGIAPLADCYHPERKPPDDILKVEHEHTARLLATAGADIILVETQNTAREARIAAQAALDTGLPVWVSLMPRSATELWNGDSLTDTARMLQDLGAEAILINCCPPPIAASAFTTLSAALPAARWGVYPNFSDAEGPPWEFTGGLSPMAFAQWAEPLLSDAAIIGGCCGTTPDHIAALRVMINRKTANRQSNRQ